MSNQPSNQWVRVKLIKVTKINLAHVRTLLNSEWQECTLSLTRASQNEKSHATKAILDFLFILQSPAGPNWREIWIFTENVNGF